MRSVLASPLISTAFWIILVGVAPGVIIPDLGVPFDPDEPMPSTRLAADL